MAAGSMHNWFPGQFTPHIWGWNPKKYSVICSMSWASRSGKAHLPSGQRKANFQLEGSPWSWRCGQWLHQESYVVAVDFNLGSLAMTCHHCTSCIHSYGVESIPLYWMVFDLTRRFIWPLTGLVFKSSSPEKSGRGTSLVADDPIMWQVALEEWTCIHAHTHTWDLSILLPNTSLWHL